MIPHAKASAHKVAPSPPPTYSTCSNPSVSTEFTTISEEDFSEETSSDEQTTDYEGSHASSDENAKPEADDDSGDTDVLTKRTVHDTHIGSSSPIPALKYASKWKYTTSAEKLLAEDYAMQSAASRAAPVLGPTKPKVSMVKNIKKLAPNTSTVEDVIKAAYKGFEEGKKEYVALDAKSKGKGVKFGKTNRTELALKIGKATFTGVKEGKRAFNQKQAKRVSDAEKMRI